MNCELLYLGIDVGSVTSKIVLTDAAGELLYSAYERHYADARGRLCSMLEPLGALTAGRAIKLAISGSAGMGIAEEMGIPFIQEVHATSSLVRRRLPEARTVIELGGEDAKIIFLSNGVDSRMNGICAGGTGAFIDQMASLLKVTNGRLDELSMAATQGYPIASRCGVFAKSDIQALMNQGVSPENVAASVYQAVVNQTIAGLAQGTPIRPPVVFLGGPLFYCAGLRRGFVSTLHLGEGEAIFPDWGRYCVALGAARWALDAERSYTYPELTALFAACRDGRREFVHAEPLFRSREEYDAFVARHDSVDVPEGDVAAYAGRAYLGIDCGSTTTKLLLLSEDDRILYSYYGANAGDPVRVLLAELKKLDALCGGRITIAGSVVTGYGEELVRHAFGVDAGVVETMAHLRAARFFCPDVDFILDIGGQDIKCFRIRQGAVDTIMLNEACSSGCGSFLETFASALGMTAAEFSREGLFAETPAELGTRCTVFMNSSVKQAQRDGARIGDISAGLSASVVKNALYKVIRVHSAQELGERIVVQGGTFHNDAVLRCFEREIGREVVRPRIAGLMGAFGAALTARGLGLRTSALLRGQALETFTHAASAAVCRGCSNSCRLTINTFSTGGRYVSGNRCPKGEGGQRSGGDMNLYAFKRDYLAGLRPSGTGVPIALPLALEMYDAAPFWHAALTQLGFDVSFSRPSSKSTYYEGQFTIPSDTICYPAKLMHGHMAQLAREGARLIFYPCCTYNFKEDGTDNSYHCPVVAYYPEVLKSCLHLPEGVRLMYPYLDMSDGERLSFSLQKELKKYGFSFTRRDIRAAVERGRAAYDSWRAAIEAEGRRIVAAARAQGKKIIVLAGRPYHADPEVNHGIDTLICSLGCAAVTEDSVAPLAAGERTGVLNQWTYHSRIYKAAKWVCGEDDAELVQLVSFGCGLDAITTDETRVILERAGKLYTQVKIDEITNLGAVRIRLRSLLAAAAEREARA